MELKSMGKSNMNESFSLVLPYDFLNLLTQLKCCQLDIDWYLLENDFIC